MDISSVSEETDDPTGSANTSRLQAPATLPSDSLLLSGSTEAEDLYRYLFDASPQPMWIYDHETLEFLLVNRAAQQHYGYSQEEFQGMTLRDVRPVEDVPLFLGSLSLQTQDGKHGIWRHRKKSGEIIEVEITAHNFRWRGRASRLALLHDITDWKRIERALQQSEQEQRLLADHLEQERARLAEAQAMAKVGSWEQNLTTQFLFWSEETYRIFGVDPLEEGASYEVFRSRVHPDDWPLLEKAFETALASHTPYACDHRILMPDGSTKFVHERCKISYDASGRPVRAVGTVQDITERRQAESDLQHIMEGAHCLLWQAQVIETDAETLRWTLRFANEQAAQRFLPLRVDSELDYAMAWYYSRPEEDRDRTDRYAAEEIRAGRNYQQEFRCQGRNGELRWLSESVRVETLEPGRWRCIGVCIDITERKQAEETARMMIRGAQCLLWYAFVEDQPHGHQWYIETPDEEAAQNFFPIAQPPDCSYMEAFTRSRMPEDSPAMDACGTEALVTGKPGYTQQFRCRRADGEWRWLNETVRVELLSPGRWHCVGVCTDVTEQKRAEAERDRFLARLQETEAELRKSHGELEARVARRTAQLTESNALLLAAKQEAEEANRAKSEFLSRMSHELRTPLNAILGFGQILEKQSLTPLQDESLRYILTGGRHLLDLINEILDVSRVEAGRIELALEPLMLSEIVSEACALVGPLAAERGIQIEIVPQKEQSVRVLADRQRLKQALINLLSNGIKYNYRGGRVRIACSSEPKQPLRISVHDTGPGLTPEEQKKLFIPFERLNAPRSGVEGTGLGLVLTRYLVMAMGGELTLESVPGEGSTFFITLPHPSSQTIPSDVTDRAQLSAASLGKRTFDGAFPKEKLS